jgi:membrane protein
MNWKACDFMTGTAVTRSPSAGTSTAAQTPLWVIGLSALLIAGGFGPRSSQEKMHPERNEARESGRGRSADTPSEIPAPGWKDILVRVYHGISENRILLVAAGVTFYGLLAIFPGVAALVSIYGLFADPASMTDHLDTIASVAPGGAIEVLRDQMTHLASKGGTTLGISFLLGLSISLWTANSGVKAVFDALNIVYQEQEKRGFITLNAVTLAITILAVGFILTSVGVVIALPVVLNYLPIAQLTDVLVKLARWPLMFAAVTLALAVLYRYGPSRTKPRWRWITWGSASAAIVWLGASALFSWYVANFGSYNKTYGSLGAIIGFMTWMWISIIVVLVGAKLNAEMEHQTVRESTAGQAKPLGARGARMADTVGPAQA